MELDLDSFDENIFYFLFEYFYLWIVLLASNYKETRHDMNVEIYLFI